MCQAYYLATDLPSRLIPWHEARPAFNVVPLMAREGGVLKQFSRPSIVHLGAHTGCSCGFAAADDAEVRGESSAALRAYLREVVAEQGTAEFFACWEGEQDVAPAERLDLVPEDFAGERLEDAVPPWFARIRPAV